MVKRRLAIRSGGVAILCGIAILMALPLSRGASPAGSLSAPGPDRGSRRCDLTAASPTDLLAAVRPQTVPGRGPGAMSAPSPEPPSPPPAMLADLSVPPLRPGMHGPRLSAPPRPPPA